MFVDVPWTSSKDTWTLTVTGSDGTSGKKTKAIGDNDPCTTPVPDPTAPPSPDPVDPQPISPSVDPGGADTPSSAGEPEEQAVENRVLDFCDSKDPADLPEGMADAEVAMTVTNSVSTTEIREPWANLYCVAKANRTSADAIKALPAGGSGASGSSSGSDSGDDVLAKTGGTALTATAAGGVILLAWRFSWHRHGVVEADPSRPRAAMRTLRSLRGCASLRGTSTPSLLALIGSSTGWRQLSPTLSPCRN